MISLASRRPEQTISAPSSAVGPGPRLTQCIRATAGASRSTPTAAKNAPSERAGRRLLADRGAQKRLTSPGGRGQGPAVLAPLPAQDSPVRPRTNEARRWQQVAGIAAGSLLWVAPRTAHAMHLAEGILPLPWAALWTAVALPFVALALRLYKRRAKSDLFYRPLVA